MLKEFLTHKLAYFSLIATLITFVLVFAYVWPNREATQMLIYIMMSVYILWGCIVHTKSKRLSVRIVLEYVAVAALAGACLHVLIL